MIDSGVILPEQFYSSTSEKVKINWFCYEYALKIFSAISEDLHINLKRSGIAHERIKEFSIHYSKKMKPMIFDVLSKKVDKTVHSYEPIEEFFPNIEDELLDELLTTVAEAWDSLLSICEVCPTRCISEKDEKTKMFDEASDCDIDNLRL